MFFNVVVFLLKFSTEMLIRTMNGTLTHNGSQISEGTNSVGLCGWIWAFAYVLLAAVFFSLIISTL
jgi:hypothetical protein